MKKIISETNNSHGTRLERMHWNVDAVSHLMGGLVPLEQQCFEKKEAGYKHERGEK